MNLNTNQTILWFRVSSPYRLNLMFYQIYQLCLVMQAIECIIKLCEKLFTQGNINMTQFLWLTIKKCIESIKINLNKFRNFFPGNWEIKQFAK